MQGAERDMTHEEKWMAKFHEVKSFIERNRRNPSRYDPEERGRYCNWIKHNKKLLNSGGLAGARLALFTELAALMKRYKRKNQHEVNPHATTQPHLTW